MGPVSKVDVALVSDGDMPTCVDVLSKSFGHDAPFVDIYFPNHDTPAGQAQASKRLVAWKQSSESSTFLKAITRADDGSQEHIIGLAVWTFMKEAPPAELSEAENVEEVWPDEDDREFMTRLWREYVIPRTRTIRDSGAKGVYGMWQSMIRKGVCFVLTSQIVLELLAVHPDFQRRGAGRALVEWGTRAADEQGVKVCNKFPVFSFCSQSFLNLLVLLVFASKSVANNPIG